MRRRYPTDPPSLVPPRNPLPSLEGVFDPPYGEDDEEASSTGSQEQIQRILEAIGALDATLPSLEKHVPEPEKAQFQRYGDDDDLEKQANPAKWKKWAAGGIDALHALSAIQANRKARKRAEKRGWTYRGYDPGRASQVPIPKPVASMALRRKTDAAQAEQRRRGDANVDITNKETEINARNSESYRKDIAKIVGNASGKVLAAAMDVEPEKIPEKVRVVEAARRDPAFQRLSPEDQDALIIRILRGSNEPQRPKTPEEIQEEARARSRGNWEGRSDAGVPMPGATTGGSDSAKQDAKDAKWLENRVRSLMANDTLPMDYEQAYEKALGELEAMKRARAQYAGRSSGDGAGGRQSLGRFPFGQYQGNPNMWDPWSSGIPELGGDPSIIHRSPATAGDRFPMPDPTKLGRPGIYPERNTGMFRADPSQSFGALSQQGWENAVDPALSGVSPGAYGQDPETIAEALEGYRVGVERYPEKAEDMREDFIWQFRIDPESVPF